MFEAGNLLYFKPFIFKNGALPKNKFMVVLGQDANGNTLLASLPTSKDHVPGDIEVKGGCIDLPKRQVNVFVFSAGENITIAQAGTDSFAFGVKRAKPACFARRLRERWSIFFIIRKLR